MYKAYHSVCSFKVCLVFGWDYSSVTALRKFCSHFIKFWSQVLILAILQCPLIRDRSTFQFCDTHWSSHGTFLFHVFFITKCYFLWSFKKLKILWWSAQNLVRRSPAFPVITHHLTVKCNMKLKLYIMLKRGIWKGKQIIFYKAVMVPVLTCSGHTACIGSEV
jgi:hypothetical protein